MNPRAKQPVGKAAASLELLDSEPGAYAVYAWSNTTIVIWPRQAVGATVDRLARVTATKAREFPTGFSNIHVVKDGAGMPSPEAKAGFVRLMQEAGNSLACVATVLLGTGFWVSALQSVITGMRLLAPGQFEHRLFTRIEAAATWVPKPHAARTGVSLESDALLKAIEDAYGRTMSDAETVDETAAVG